MNEQAATSEYGAATLAYDLAAERLRGATRWGGVVLLLSPALPFEVVENSPVFVWDVLGELGPAAQVAALAPCAAGLAILAAGKFVKRPSVIAALLLLILGVLTAVALLGADAAAWDITPLPDSVTRRPELAMLGVALSGAALRLMADQASRRAARMLGALALLFVGLFALLPARGEIPITTFVRMLAALAELPNFRLLLGYGSILLAIAWPLLSAGVAGVFVFSGERRHAPLLSAIVVFALPAFIMMLAFRSVLLTLGDTSVIAVFGSGALLSALLTLLSRASEVTALHFTGVGRDSERERGMPFRTQVAIFMGLAALVVVAQAVLSSAPTKGVDFKLGSDSKAADQLYGELVPNWAASRARWSSSARSYSSAEELATTRASAAELMDHARRLHPELAKPFAALLQESNHLDLAGRRWFRMIEDLNEATRRSGLPYYLDPDVRSVRTRGKHERLFDIHAYRVERVRSVRVLDAPYALLHVRRLGEGRSRHQLLGFSRDTQAFALVVLDEVEETTKQLNEFAKRATPTCADVPTPSPIVQRCGSMLRAANPTFANVLALTERHELQHQIDGPHLTVASAVLEELQGFAESAVQEVNRELSAYLAELTDTRGSPKLALAHVLPFVLYRPRSSVLYRVSLLEFEALANRDLRESVGEVAISKLSAAFDELASLSDDALRSRASQAYAKLFGRAPPKIAF